MCRSVLVTRWTLLAFPKFAWWNFESVGWFNMFISYLCGFCIFYPLPCFFGSLVQFVHDFSFLSIMIMKKIYSGSKWICTIGSLITLSGFPAIRKRLQSEFNRSVVEINSYRSNSQSSRAGKNFVLTHKFL